MQSQDSSPTHSLVAPSTATSDNNLPQPDSILSDRPLSDWQGFVTTFRGFTGTTPDKEIINAPWSDVAKLLRADAPNHLQTKQNGQYVIPCLLKEAPLVGKTLDAANRDGKPSAGKMRSKSHITPAMMIFMDVDGLPEEELSAAMDKIKADGITHLAYTTHSHGNPDKPGMRVRFVIPIDRALPNDEYRAAWKGLNERYFNGKADSSSANIYQQQGTWCCHPDRIDQAESWRHDIGVVSADTLIKLGGGVEPSKPSKKNAALTQNGWVKKG